MFYTESEIISDFDQLSLLTGGTPKEKITGYSLTLSAKQKENSFESKPAQTIDGVMSFPTCGNTSTSRIKRSLATISGKGRGKIIYKQTTENTMESEPHFQLEKEIRLAIPESYRNESIEHHFAHHLKESPQIPKPLAMSEVPIASNNVALLSLTRNAKKCGKKLSTPNSLEMNDKNFPRLK